MLESAEIGHRISKADYAREEPKLRKALLNAQWDLSQSGKGPVLLIISGVEAGGRGETANKLTEWMDPRHIRVVAFGPRTGDELTRPLPWRYWRALPAKGRVGIFMNAWYTETLVAHLRGKISVERLQLRLESIRHHERMLADEGLVLLKFWVHLSKKDQQRRLKRLEKDPRTSWRVTRRDWDAWRLYSKSHELWEHVLRESSTGAASISRLMRARWQNRAAGPTSSPQFTGSGYFGGSSSGASGSGGGAGVDSSGTSSTSSSVRGNGGTGRTVNFGTIYNFGAGGGGGGGPWDAAAGFGGSTTGGAV